MIVRHYDREYEVELMDDGTLDTVVRVRPASTTDPAPWQEVRFDHEYCAELRDATGAMTEGGLEVLGKEAADEYDYLTAYMETGWV